MNIPFNDLKSQYLSIKQEIDNALCEVIETNAFIGNLNNQFVRRFETNFANYLGIDHCIACANGTDSIEILLKAMGVNPGDEVIVPALSWISTSEAVSNVGAKPVFVDIEPDYYCIDANLIVEKITNKTKAIIPVHLYGHPANMDLIMDIAKKHKLLVLEDCAQAHGAEINGSKVGTLGDAASFSFFPGKNLGAWGDAGGMVTNNEQIALKARMISQHGQSEKKHHHLIEGRNSRMDGINAAILDVKLKYLNKWTDDRIFIASSYYEGLNNMQLELPKIKQNNKHVFHLFVVRIDRRDSFMNYLKENGITTAIQYPTALPFLDAYKNLDLKYKDYPVASKIQNKIVSLPIFPELEKSKVEYISEKIRDYLNSTEY